MRLPFLLVGLTLLMGCAASPGGPVIHSVTKAPRSLGPAVTAPLPVVVLGRPPDGADADAVAQALRLPQRLGGGGVVAVPAGTGGLRLVISFSAAGLNSLCRADAARETRAAALTLSVGLCRDGAGLAFGILSAEGIAGPSDPDFASAMSTLLREVLVPRQQSNRPS
ncbi:MAG: hypothetical protein AAGD12_01075 [Pseudomonadota bacterium]